MGGYAELMGRLLLFPGSLLQLAANLLAMRLVDPQTPNLNA